MKGYHAISRGLIAIGAGDHRVARKSADEAARLSPDEPLTLLLSAQSAQMAGDRGGADSAFRAMVRRDETKLLGLRGLYVEAQRRDDPRAALAAAEEAAKVEPSLAWAGQAVLDYRCAARDWAGALEALDRMKSALEKNIYRRKRAVLLTAHALALNETDRDASRARGAGGGQACAGSGAGRGARRTAARRSRRAAQGGKNSHRRLGRQSASRHRRDLRQPALRRQRARAPGAGEASGGESAGPHRRRAGAGARRARGARLCRRARGAASYLAAPTRRVATLMAEIEEAEHGDEGRVREWMGRAMRASGDPVWTADGVVSERWLPVTPKGRLDGFEWKQPLAEIGVRRPVIEASETGSPPAGHCAGGSAGCGKATRAAAKAQAGPRPSRSSRPSRSRR